MCRAVSERAAARDSRWLAAAAWVLAACVSACASVGGERLATQVAVSGSASGYRLVPPSDGWRRAEPERDADGESPDLRLVYADGIELVVWVHASGGASIDEIVDARRSIAADAFEITAYAESRNFLDEDEVIPASFAVYGGRVMGVPLALQVLTVDDGSRIYELVGRQVGGGPGDASALHALMLSFSLAPGGKP